MAGLWCASLGFGSERLAKVAYEQMRELGYYHLYRHRSNEPVIELAEKLLEIAPVPMARVIFQCSGSEANDTAIKLAWYYWHSLGQPQRTKIIARQMAYHGNTCAAVSLSGKPDMHAGFGLPFANFKHTEFPHYYRRHEAGETEEEFSTRMAEALDALIQAEGPDTIAAFFAEPVMGAGGAIMPPSGYFAKMQAVLKKYDILFVADEVICGFARTGEMWGSQTYGIKPDMISSAKALSAAMQPISAVLINERVHEAMLSQSDKFGNFAHGYTYSGPSRGRGRRAGGAEHLRRDGHRRARQAAGPRAAIGARQVQGSRHRRRRARHRAHSRHGADARWQEAHSLRSGAQRGLARRCGSAEPRPDRARGRRPAGVRAALDHRGGRNRGGRRPAGPRAGRCCDGTRARRRRQPLNCRPIGHLQRESGPRSKWK